MNAPVSPSDSAPADQTPTGAPVGAPERDDSDLHALAARKLAVRWLEQVILKRRALEDAIEHDPDLGALDPRDRAFAHLLILTLLRRLRLIDRIIDKSMDRKKLPQGPARDALRLGIVQLLFIGTPPHAAVKSSVALVRRLGGGQHDKFVNAVLRRLATDGAKLIKRQDEARLAVPDWIWTSWGAAYGPEAARASAEALLREPPLDLTLKNPDEAVLWAERLGARVLPTGSLRRPGSGGDLRALPGFAEGAWWVQDAAAALPVRLLGPIAGLDVLDLCAAPGGKTAQLCAAGARVTAVDRSGPRLKRLHENLARLGLSAAVVEADAGLWRPETPADAVLLDAPCSATGSARRHPDVLHLKTPEDIERLTALQDRLLDAAAAMVKPGGRIVYATCSLQPEEGEARITAFLERCPAARLDPVRPEELGGCAELISPDGYLRTLPAHLAELGGIDGFFAARLMIG